MVVGGIHEALQAGGSAIGILHREREHAVVTPVARSGELGDGHEFDGGDADFPEFLKPGDDAVERSCGAERAHVEFADDVILDGAS